jgi:anaerobic selenocysteine-containing dehydrogenase
MGFEDSCLYETEAEMISQALDHKINSYTKEITYERLVKQQYLKANVKPLLPGKLMTPSGKIELYSKQMADHGYPPLPTYEPIVHDGDFPFLFIPGPNHNYINSTFSNNEKHISLEKEPRLHINVNDAERLDITDGEWVEIWNSRGNCSLKASVGENVLPGVVVTQGLWADLPNTKQLVNSLTPDRAADMGNGATFFSCRVDVKKLDKYLNN